MWNLIKWNLQLFYIFQRFCNILKRGDLMEYSDYKKLRYKFENEEYKRVIAERINNSVLLPLKAKNGEVLRFVKCSEIDKLLSEIESVYKKAEADPVKFVTDEAYSTCTIEGARSTIADTVKLSNGKEPSNHSEKMIKNNINAIELVLNRNFNFNEDSVLKLWKVLSDGAVDNLDIQGDKYRVDDVVIADSMGNISFYAPEAEKIEDMMTKLFEFAHHNDELNDFVKAVIIHYYFVYVHPFCDGNGRCARLLLQDYLIDKGFEKFRGISISTGVLKNKSGYYRALENSENEYNDITFIIIFYLETILDVLYQACEGFGYNERHLDMSNRQKQVIVYLRKNTGNIITADIYARRYNVDIETSKKELDELVEAKILTSTIGDRTEYKAN
jgi:Fic family protein